MAEGWRAVCGDVRNVRDVPARSVAIRVQGMDSAARSSARGNRDLMAGVASGEPRGLLCANAGWGDSYHVTVLGADWGFMQGRRQPTTGERPAGDCWPYLERRRR